MTAQTARASRLPDLLICNRNFVLLWGAYGISAVGDHLSEIALLTESGALRSDRATRVQALIQFGFFLPFMLLGPVAGWWADRFSRKLTMIGADLVRAVIMLNLSVVVPWLMARGFGDYSIAIPLGAAGAFAAFFSPSRQAMLPTLIRTDQFVRANAMISALGTIGTILSAVLGGILVKHLGTLWNYRIDALTFVVSALLIAFILPPSVPHARAVRTAGVWTPLVEGFRYARQHRRVFQLILLGTVFWSAAGIVNSVIPAVVRDVFAGDVQDIGVFRGLVGVGLVLGAAFMTLAGPAMPIQLCVLASLAGGAFWVLLLGLTYAVRLGPLLTGLALVMIGAHGAALLVTINSTLQRFVPDARRGRVFGVGDMFTMGAMVLATGVLGVPEIPHLDRLIPLLLGLTGAGMLAVTWLAWRDFRRNDPARPMARIVWTLAEFYARLWFRARREGPCTIPRRGAVILAANHTSGVDPICIYATCRYRVISFLVERKYYEIPIAHWFQQLVDCIPIDRTQPEKSAVAAVLRALRDGGCVGIFPQGTFERSEGELQGKVGIARFALRGGATVIPCHISGTRYCDGILRSYFLRHRVRVRYGRPVDLSDFAGRERDKAALAEASDRIMRAIRALAPRGAADDAPRT